MVVLFKPLNILVKNIKKDSTSYSEVFKDLAALGIV